jgi:hypothetical protein
VVSYLNLPQGELPSNLLTHEAALGDKQVHCVYCGDLNKILTMEAVASRIARGKQNKNRNCLINLIFVVGSNSTDVPKGI